MTELHTRNNITYSMNCNHRISGNLCTLETCIISGIKWKIPCAKTAATTTTTTTTTISSSRSVQFLGKVILPYCSFYLISDFHIVV
jgi:hypothetical protein